MSLFVMGGERFVWVPGDGDGAWCGEKEARLGQEAWLTVSEGCFGLFPFP